MSSPTPANRERSIRRRRKHERQAVIFGILIAFMALAALLAAAVFNGAIKSPINPAFASPVASKDPAVVQPCLVEGKQNPVAFRKVKVNVYNGSKRSGVAARVAKDLEKRGFTILAAGNSQTRISGVRIAFGTKGLRQAYTVAAHFPDATLYFDARVTSVIDITLGSTFSGMVDVEKLTIKAGQPMENRPGCQPLEMIKPAPAPPAEVKPSASASPAA